ncbi:MAG: hypothetical protein ACM3YM_11235 [Sphingomonadales bacterium]
MSDWELEPASRLFDFLRSKGLRCLNNPAKVRTRVELLRLLAEKGISDIGVWRADEAPKPGKFPVFIRGEHDHAYPVSKLIENQNDLDEELERIRENGRSLRGLIVLEHRPAPYDGGLFHKWGAFRIGDSVSVDHLAVDRTWLVKYGDYALLNDDIISDEHDAVMTNRLADELMPIFDAADIEYGRADYAIIDGRLTVYEINTNPNIGEYIPAKNPMSLEKQRRARERLAVGLYSIDTEEEGHVDLDIEHEFFLRVRRNPANVPFWRR